MMMMEVDNPAAAAVVAPSTSSAILGAINAAAAIPSTSQQPEKATATILLRDHPQSCYSPNFNFLAVGNEAEKLKWLVLQHVKPSTLKKVFAPLMNPDPKKRMERSDELVCVQACMLLRALEPMDKNRPPNELEQACQGLISLLNTEKIHLMALDRIITKIIITAAEEKIISLLLACQLLVTSIDFRMLKPPNPAKIQFVRKSMDQMDYKNMRDLLKLLLVEKLDKMHCQLTEYQHQQLVPLEELVIDLIDRRKNFCPALFFITEISRIDTDHSSIHFLPRVSLKIREMVASFRPLAEIASMLGRSWMWPVPASPIFSWGSQTWSACWKLDDKHCKLYFKTHLPYNSETSTPQTYLQYILFKQPHGQDNLNHIIRTSTSQDPRSSRLQCDEVIQLLILEAMCAMEDSEQEVLDPINQYNWLHLSHLVTYALWMGHCTLSQLLMMLLPQLKSCQYLRAKEELMWILLQYISYAKQKEKQQQQQQQQQAAAAQHPSGGSSASAMITLPQSGGIGTQNRELVLEIFNVLYGPDKSMNWGDTCSTEKPLNMVRFFSPAAIWINLVSSSAAGPGADKLPQPQPPEKLRTLIDFIEKQLHENKEQKQLEKNPAILAIVANAYSNNHEVFEEHVNKTIFRMLGHPQSQHQSQQSQSQMQQEKWALPGGRKAEPFLRALELSFLDLLTFNAKRSLYNSSLPKICSSILWYQQQQQQPQQQAHVLRLPSPALVESTARLLLSTELCDQNGQLFYYFASYSLKMLSQGPSASEPKEILARSDLVAIFMELLNFRLQNMGFGWKWELTTRITFLYNVLMQLLQNQSIIQSPMPNHVQLCQLLEQTVLRFSQCTWPQDMLTSMQYLYKRLQNFPELFRAYMLNAMRAAKLLGDAQLPVGIPDICFQWPRFELQWFPEGVQKFLYEHMPQYEHDWVATHERQMVELEQESLQEMQYLLHLDADYFRLTQQPNNPYANSTLFISIFRFLYYQSHVPNFQPPPSTKPPHPATPNFSALCYKLLGTLGNKDLHKLTNALVDWLAWKLAWLGGGQSPQPAAGQAQGAAEEYELNNVVQVLNGMLFAYQFLPIERLLFAIALHPTDDQSIRTLLCLLAAMLDPKISKLPERLHACYAFAPAHSQTTSSNSEDFFVKMAEYYKKYPESSYGELYRQALSQPPPPDPNWEPLILPIYYGHLAERICPIVDVLLQRALETEPTEQTMPSASVLDTLLRHLSPIYRIHPQPMIFLYTTLFTLDGILVTQQQQSETATTNGAAFANRPVRKFVLEIVLKLEQEEATVPPATRTPQIPPAGKLLTPEFIQHDHQMAPIKFCRVLVERIVQASTYTHQPPAFVHHDWRFAEFSPAAQALTSAWVELLASRHSPADIVDSLVHLAIRRPIYRPLDTLNALGLLLTGLPASFQSAFLDKIEQSFDWEQIARTDADPSQLFESLSHEVYLHSSSRILSMLALIHSFCQHGGNNSLGLIAALIVERLAPKVENEAQLLYFLRIVVPYLQRINEKERNRHMTEIVSIYNVLGHLTQKIGQLRYEDTICDLLYQFKYMYVGYMLKDQTEQAIRSFPDSMREKLKFLLTHSSSAAVAADQQQHQMQQILHQQQQILQHQSSQASLFAAAGGSIHPPMTAAAIMAAQHQQQQQAAAAAAQFGGQYPMGGQPPPFPMHPSQQQFQQPPFGGLAAGPFDPSSSSSMAQPALIGMLRKPSRLSGDGVGGGPMEMPPQSSSSGAQGPAAILPPGMMMMAPQMQMGMGQGQGAPTVMGMIPPMSLPQQQLPISTNSGSANVSPNPPQQQQKQQQQQIAPPPPYSQHSGMPGMPQTMQQTGMVGPPPPHSAGGPQTMFTTANSGQMPMTTSGGSHHPLTQAQFQQQQQMMAASQQMGPGAPQFPMIGAAGGGQFPAQQMMGFPTTQSHVPQMTAGARGTFDPMAGGSGQQTPQPQMPGNQFPPRFPTDQQG